MICTFGKFAVNLDRVDYFQSTYHKNTGNPQIEFAFNGGDTIRATFDTEDKRDAAYKELTR
jgi:hypothetical protein